MPAQNVAVPHTEFVQKSNRHDQLIQGLPNIDVGLQKLLAELIMMRLFDDLQEALSGVALRLACGTSYADGMPPILLTAPAKSTAGARVLYETFGRPKPQGMKWSKATFINETTKYVLDPANPFTVACNANAVVMAEMQAVRNRIAHANANSRKAFAIVVQKRYGAKLNNISPGTLLVSSRFSPSLLQQYLSTCRIVAKACARA